jgi:hypothetical protein
MVRAFLGGQLPAERTQELHDHLLTAGVPSWHSHRMWILPDVFEPFSNNVGPFTPNVIPGAPIFSVNVVPKSPMFLGSVFYVIEPLQLHSPTS